MKVGRQNKIIELITRHNVETQEELAELLNQAGYQVTQATISRDIRELKLTKVQAENGRQKYVALKKDADLGEKYVRVLKEGFISMDLAQNLVVVKTVSGMAMAVAAAINPADIWMPRMSNRVNTNFSASTAYTNMSSSVTGASPGSSAENGSRAVNRAVPATRSSPMRRGAASSDTGSWKGRNDSAAQPRPSASSGASSGMTSRFVNIERVGTTPKSDEVSGRVAMVAQSVAEIVLTAPRRRRTAAVRSLPFGRAFGSARIRRSSAVAHRSASSTRESADRKLS